MRGDVHEKIRERKAFSRVIEVKEKTIVTPSGIIEDGFKKKILKSEINHRISVSALLVIIFKKKYFTLFLDHPQFF